jgi:VWFA-related protein
MSKWLPLVFLLAAPMPRAAGQTLRSDTRLVLVPVSVTDGRGATVDGLDRSNFSVFEDKTPQPIVAFSAEDAPTSVGLIFDTSGSMAGRLNVAKAALRAFVDNANPADEAFLFTVSTHPDVSSTFTTDLASLAANAHFLSARGDTALIPSMPVLSGCGPPPTHAGPF